MKQLIIRCAFLILALAMIGSSSLAQQNNARIAYVNSDRTQILAKWLGGKVDTLLQSTSKIKFSHLSVLGSTHEGKSLLIAGTVKLTFAGRINPDSLDFFARADSPFFVPENANPNPLSNPLKLGPLTLLKHYTPPTEQQLQPPIPFPLGVISANEFEWFGTWTKAGEGNTPLWFFHGKFDGSGTVDSIALTDANAVINGHHMTNLTCTENSSTMVTVVMDNTRGEFPRAQIIRWNPFATDQSKFQITDMSNSLKNLRSGGVLWDFDTAFGFALRIVPNGDPNNPRAELGLIPGKSGDRSIHLYQFNINNLASGFTDTRTIAQNAIPDSLRMFVGYTNNPGSAGFDDGREVFAPTVAPGALGNGGDIMFSPSGDSVVFITCAKDYTADSVHSMIYMYDIANHKSTIFVNDPHKMERQPIFMGHWPAPPPPYVRGVADLAFPSFNLGSVYTDSTGQVTETVRSKNGSKVILVSAAIQGTGAAAYSIVSPPTFPVDLAGGASRDFKINFAPKSEGTFDAQLVIHYRDSLMTEGQPDSMLTASLTGIGTKRPEIGSVRAEAERSFAMNIVPNPLKNLAEVQVEAKMAGLVSLEVIDERGASLSKTESKMLSEGEHTVFNFNASELGLTQGTYYLVLHTPQGDVMRKAIVIK